ncbi:MAG: DUF4212 domain-containing protein [Methyloceanibacter sp.]
MATEVPAIGHTGRNRHKLRTMILAVAILFTVLIAVLVAVLNAEWLNKFWFLHFPLGFYLLAQGLFIFIVMMTFWYVRLQERIDHSRSTSEELG